MTGDDLRAAAGRLIRDDTGDARADLGESDLFERLSDGGAVARSWLAEHPADDGEPVTAEWLESVGFWGRGRTELCSPRPARWMLICDGDPVPGFSDLWNISFPGCQQPLGYDLPTRGHVRRLCAALGIPLTEGGGR